MLSTLDRDSLSQWLRRSTTNLVLSPRIVPRRVRAQGLRLLGVPLGQSLIQHRVYIENFNLEVGDNVKIGHGVRILGAGRIEISDNASISDYVTIDTDRHLGENSVWSAPLRISGTIPPGSTIGPRYASWPQLSVSLGPES